MLLISLLLGLSQNIAIAADFSISHNEPQTTSHKKEMKKVITKALKHKQKLRNKKQVKRYTDRVQQQKSTNDSGDWGLIVFGGGLTIALLVGIVLIGGWIWLLWTLLILVAVALGFILMEVLLP